MYTLKQRAFCLVLGSLCIVLTLEQCRAFTAVSILEPKKRVVKDFRAGGGERSKW